MFNYYIRKKENIDLAKKKWTGLVSKDGHTRYRIKYRSKLHPQGCKYIL